MSDITLTQAARNLKELKARRDEAKREYEALAEEFKIDQARLLERMEEEENEGIKADGTNFVPSATVYATVQDRSAFVEWATENDPELIEPRERGELINQLVREHLDDGRPLPPGLGSYVREFISQRAA